MPDLPWPGRHYHRRYGYAVGWAILAELAWRLEHLPFSHDGQPFARLARRGYRWRKTFERVRSEDAIATGTRCKSNVHRLVQVTATSRSLVVALVLHGPGERRRKFTLIGLRLGQRPSHAHPRHLIDWARGR